jgi:MFS family permease
VLAAYQASMMMGRVAGAALLRWVSKGPMVLAAAVGSVLGTGVMLGWHTPIGMTAGVVISGLSFATIYPTMLAIAGDRYLRFAGTVFGILFSISMVGAMVFPWSVGHLPGGATVHSGIAVPLAGAIGICVLATILRLRGELQGLSCEENRPSSLVQSR